MLRIFLDTSTIISAILPRREDCIHALAIMLQNKVPLVVNQYVIKELRRVLPKFVEEPEMGKMIEFIETKSTVVRTPHKNECRRIKCRDRSDSPVISSALKEKCILVTEDFKTREDAGKYVISLTAKETVRVLGFNLPEKGKRLVK